MIFADIGNSHIHICKDDKVEHLMLNDAVEKYSLENIHYISVRGDTDQIFADAKNWIDISEKVRLKGEYNGMGVDRKALCLSHKSGIFVDAGSAITVDKVIDGEYLGGFVVPGIHSYRELFVAISPALDYKIDKSISLNILPRSTSGGISYGVVAPIVAAIEKIQCELPLYFTGGDGEWLSSYFKDALFDEKLVFLGIRQAILGIRNEE